MGLELWRPSVPGWGRLLIFLPQWVLVGPSEPVSLSHHRNLLKEGFPDIHPPCILTFYFLNIKFSRSLVTYVTQIKTQTLLPTQCQGPGSDKSKKGLLEAGFPKHYLPSFQRSTV